MLDLNILFTALTYLLAAVGAHIGMVDDDYHRDVGLVYPLPDYKGNATRIFEIKNSPECMPLGGQFLSIKICKEDVKCTFYTGDSCVAGQDNFAVAIGCGDADHVNAHTKDHFHHYRCGPASEARATNQTITTVPHDATQDTPIDNMAN
ncbi:hypothetical protein ACEQ8H_000592 [Pleosporales sp. CAS-2024a]